MSWFQRVLKGGKKGTRRRQKMRDNALKATTTLTGEERANAIAQMEKDWLKKQQKKAVIATAVVATAVVGGAVIAPALASAGGGSIAAAGASGASAAGGGAAAFTGSTGASLIAGVKTGVAIFGTTMSAYKSVKNLTTKVPGVVPTGVAIPQNNSGGILPLIVGAAGLILLRK